LFLKLPDLNKESRLPFPPQVIPTIGLAKELRANGLYIHSPCYSIHVESSLSSLHKSWVITHEIVHAIFFFLRLPYSFHKWFDILNSHLEPRLFGGEHK